MKDGVEIALLAAGLAVVVGGSVAAGVFAAKEDVRRDKFLQQTMQELAARIETELTTQNENFKNSKIEITALRASTKKAEVGEYKSDELSVYGTISNDNLNKVFKVVYSTSDHKPFEYFYLVNKFCKQVSTAVLESITVTDYSCCYSEGLSTKDLANIFVPEDNSFDNTYIPLFAEVGSYEKDGKTYGYVNYDGIYTREYDGQGYFINTIPMANLWGQWWLRVFRFVGSSPDIYVKENSLTCEITKGCSQEEIYNEIMSKAKSHDASVTLDCTYSGCWDLPDYYLDSLETEN